MITVGVDTHKHRHTAVAVDDLGRIHGQVDVSADPAGFRRLLDWGRSFDRELRFGIESTGSYGSGLCRYLESQGRLVYEVQAPALKSRRRGKSDVQDAFLAAKTVLSGEGVSMPRSSGPREQLRVLIVAYDGVVHERTAIVCRIESLIVSAPTALRERIGKLRGIKLHRRLLAMRTVRTVDAVDKTTLSVLRDLAKRSIDLDRQACAYKQNLGELVGKINRSLLEEKGVGPISAAKLLLSSPERFKNEAAFAAINGTAPIPASSGKTNRHRLNRGGDRQLNYALHMVALSRVQHHSESRAYVERRISEGKSRREAMRALKRNLSKRLFKVLQLTAWPAGALVDVPT